MSDLRPYSITLGSLMILFQVGGIASFFAQLLNLAQGLAIAGLLLFPPVVMVVTSVSVAKGDIDRLNVSILLWSLLSVIGIWMHTAL